VGPSSTRDAARDDASRSAQIVRLRSRLREFWSKYDGYLDNPLQEVTGEGSLRVRAASSVLEGSRILHVACGLETNSVC